MKKTFDKIHGLINKAQQIFDNLQNKANSFEYKEEINLIFEEILSYQTKIEQQKNELQIINEKLQKGRNKFQELYFEAPIAYFTVNCAGNIIQINNFAADLINVKINDVIGLNFTSFVCQNEIQKFKDNFNNVVNSTKLSAFELNLISSDNKKLQTQVQIKCFSDNQNLNFCRLTVTDISKYKLYENQIKLKNKQFELFFSQSLTGFFFMMLDKPIFWNDSVDKEKILDYVFENQKVTMINSAMLNQYKAEEKDFLGFTPSNFFEHDINAGREVWQKLFDNGKLHIHTNEKRFDGTQMVVDGDYICLYDEQGRITGHFGVQQDVTDVIKVQKELQESEKRLKDIIYSSDDWMWEIDEQGKYSYVSEKIENFLGYKPQEIVGKSPFEFIKTDDVDKIKEIFSELQKNKLPIKDLQNWNYHKNGKLVCLLTNGVPIINEKNELKGYRGVDRDITQKIIDEKLSKENELRWRFAIEGNKDGIWDWNMKTNEVFFSEQWKKMIGYNNDEINNNIEEWNKRVHIDDKEDVYKKIYEHIDKKSDVYQSEYRLRCKDGSYKWILDRGKIIEFDEIGEPLRMIGTHSDITERKNSEQNIKDINKKLTQERKLFVQGNVVIFKWKNKKGWPVEYVSANVQNILGYSSKEVTDPSFEYSKLIHKDDADMVAQEVDVAIKNKQNNFDHKPYRLIDKEGKNIWVHDFTTIIYNENGKITDFLGYLVDVSDVIEANSKIKLLSNLVEQSPAYIFITDLKGNIEYVNKAFTQVMGYTFDEVKNKNASILKSGRVKPETYKKMWDSIEKGLVWRGEIINKRKNGDEIYENVMISPIFNDQNQIVKFFSIKDDITEKKKVEIALRKSEKKFRFLAENSRDIIFKMLLIDRSFEYINPTIQKLTGYSILEFYKSPNFFKSIIHPDFADIYEKEIANLSKGVFSENLEFKIVCKEGSEKWLLQRLTLVKDDDQKIIAAEGILIDVTQRNKEHDAAVREGEEKFKTLVENAQIGITLSDPNGKIYSTNKAALDIYGVSEQQIANISSIDYYADLSDRKKLLDMLFNTGSVKNYEAKLVHSSGKNIYVNLNMSFVIVNKQKYVLTTHLDITETKLAEYAIKQSEEKFRTFVDNSSDAIRLTDENGVIIFVNKAHQKLTGYSENEVVGKHIWDFMFVLSPESQKNTNTYNYFNQNALELLKDIKDHSFKSVYEVSIQTKDNKILEVKESVFQIKTNKGIRLGSLVHDITELKNQQKRLKNLVATKDKFFSIIAHDLRTPFNALLGFTDLLNKKHTEYSAEKRQIIINSVHESAKVAFRLVENLLTWSRAQTGKLAFIPEKYPVKTLVFEAFHSNKDAAFNKNIQLIDVVKTNFNVCVDKPMIDTVLRNLISNAIKFSFPQNKILVDAKIIDGKTLFSIADFGVGIPEKRLKDLFKVDKNTSTVGTNDEVGTGLGLILCKEFIERHNGEIWAESKIDIGSTFYFKIPVEQLKENN
ncbi:MAG: PAS domain S-box protein [Bacteroidales bacterium]|nr:PAS domain S-box protein [Bacteroidales bacterium]